MKSILKLLQPSTREAEFLESKQGKETYTKEESGQNKPLKDIFGHITSFLPPHELAKTDSLCQGIKEANEYNWKKHTETYFGQRVNVGEARKAYFNNAKETTYYVVGEETITKKPFYMFSTRVPNPGESFPKTANIKVYRQKSVAQIAQKEKQAALQNDPDYIINESYFAPKHFLFAVKTSNQTPCKSDEGIEIPQEHIKQKIVIN